MLRARSDLHGAKRAALEDFASAVLTNGYEDSDL
jgi:hypothetical protein